MVDDKKSRLDAEIESLAEGKFTGEEGGDVNSTPGKNLGGAVVIGALGIYAMVQSLTFDSPDSIFTAPGLLPFITGFTLLIMCFFLGLKGVRDGGANGLLAAPVRAMRDFMADEDGRRAIMLMLIVLIYVLLVALINFELRFPNPIIELRLSSFEVVSFGMTALVLKLFWQKSWLRCAVVSFLMVEALASIFRYGFSIPMPAVG